MSSEPIRLSIDAGVAELTLANPDMNRLNRAVLDGLRSVLPRLREPDVRAVLLTGEGAVFSYGADVKELFAETPRADLHRLLGEYIGFISEMEALPKPTIAAVHGACSSGGLELALGFDHLWAAAGTKIGFMEASLGIPPLAGGVQRIAARAGSARALEIAGAARLYDAETFERWNIVNRVTAAEALHSEARAFAARLASGPTRAYAAIKAMLRRYEESGVRAADQITLPTVMPLIDSNDARESVSALLKGGPKALPIRFTGS
ncbi:enoyl-CoA hydratase/isomerase family protein [Solimonas sp. K1W22B-7]|uniref:enoyl-CoA hydratase/isomerase family protein n=1 Tax=Solimonas sp. K1W22B-7 TaxID=2303331 RepID=UPI000E334F34|nr:enoyl-CoA hydratase/isomerase family protein [Solimonas sp. K1W22B-7]AXQ29595.1 enoyl-CoA hydratase/isomerase family protein [Solimonas sp. K1W22B-7]